MTRFRKEKETSELEKPKKERKRFTIGTKEPDFIRTDGKKILTESNEYKRVHTPEYDKAKTEYYQQRDWKVINIYPKDLNERRIVEIINEAMKDGS